MPLRDQIDHLLSLPGDELKGPHAAELEDTVQRGLAAVHSGELWVRQVRQALEGDSGEDPDRLVALQRELNSARAAVEEVRQHVAPLHQRAQELGVGAPPKARI
jgi:hypothetical protein